MIAFLLCYAGLEKSFLWVHSFLSRFVFSFCLKHTHVPEMKTFSKGKFQGLLKIGPVANIQFLNAQMAEKEPNEKHMLFEFSLKKQELEDLTLAPNLFTSVVSM